MNIGVLILLFCLAFCIIALVILYRKSIVSSKAINLEREKLKKDEASVDALLKNSSDLIWSIDQNTNLTNFNRSFSESFKLFYDVEPFVGMPIIQNLHYEAQKSWTPLYERALNGEYFSEETEVDGLGIQLCFDVSLNPIIINNEITGATVFARDITSRKNAEQQLKYKINELNIFLYKATHDLRAPLASVMGLVKLAKDLKMEKELESYLDMINSSVHKMDNLLVDLFKIVNISQGKLVTNEINFELMINEILTSLSHKQEFSEIIFRKHLNINAAFKADSSLLYSVFQNLIDNAIKYKKKSDSVESIVIITVDANSEQIKIGITDNGIGIAEELQDKVFDMFYRATSSSSGTGLGLYIVKTSVEKMNGKITLNSIPEKGTSINIIFPNKPDLG